MTTPTPQETNSPPVTTPQQTPEQPAPRPPVVVNHADPAVGQTLQQLGQEIAGMPERIVNAFREAVNPPAPTQPSTEQATQTTPATQTVNLPPAQGQTPEAQPTKVSAFAKWWLGLKK